MCLSWSQCKCLSSSSGINFRQDLSAAQKVFEEAAAMGNPDAQMGLGLLYATGTTVGSSQAEALLYYTFGAFGGSPWAQMALGYRCERCALGAG